MIFTWEHRIAGLQPCTKCSDEWLLEASEAGQRRSGNGLFGPTTPRSDETGRASRARSKMSVIRSYRRGITREMSICDMATVPGFEQRRGLSDG